MPTLHYHRRALEWANVQPAYDQQAERALKDIAISLDVALPRSIVEWLCLDPASQLFHTMTHAHYFVRIDSLSRHIAQHRFTDHTVPAVELVFENQGSFVLAASLAHGDNPPVWVSYDYNFCGTAMPTWALQSDSFTDCIGAFAWDYNVIGEHAGFNGPEECLQQPPQPTDGPTTYLCSAWFRCDMFRRLECDGVRYTFFC